MDQSNPTLITSLLGDVAGTSVEKVWTVVSRVSMIDPGDDEETAQLLALFSMAHATGIFQHVVPDDPAALDALLLNGAQLFLQLRSDGADMQARIDVRDRPGVDVPHPGGGHRASADPDWQQPEPELTSEQEQLRQEGEARDDVNELPAP